MAMVTGIGLSQINRASLALAIPMMFDSYEELDYVRDRIGPKLAVEMEKAGFVVLNWGDAGWIHHFSTVPAKTPDEYRKLKYFVWSEDPASEDAWREARFQPIPLSATDVVASLRTDMIQAFGTSPVYALSSQWFNQAPYMVKVNWCPLNGATVLGKDHWDKIDPALRPKLLEIAREEGLALRAEVRSLHDKAVTAMVQRGLTAYDSDPGLTKQWREAAEIAYGVIRSKVVPAEYFDEVKKLSEEFRSKKK
jgi:TRAP-type C4-dicarboxylate transport system substrate-binding protein